MDGLVFVMNKLGLALAEMEQENAALRHQVEALTRALAERPSGSAPA